MNNTILIIGIFLFVVVLGIAIFLLLKNKSLEDIRKYCYQLFIQAEIMYGAGKGQEKLNWVVNRTYEMLPPWLKFYLTKEDYKNFVQDSFDYVTKLTKDYLDNGIIDNSIEQKQ